MDPKDILIVLMIMARIPKVTGKDLQDTEWSDLDEILLDSKILEYLNLLAD